MSNLLNEANDKLKEVFESKDKSEFDALVFGNMENRTLGLLRTFSVPPTSDDKMTKGPCASIRKYAKLAEDDMLKTSEWAPGNKLESYELAVASADDFGIRQELANLASPGSRVTSAVDSDDVSLDNIGFESRTIRFGTTSVVFIRKATPATFLKNKSFFALSSGALRDAGTELVAVENGFDAFAIGDIVYVMRPHALETLFDLHGQLQNRAGEVVQEITTKIPMKGASKLVESAGRHWQMLRKIQRISVAPYLSKITPKDIYTVAQNHSLAVELTSSDEIDFENCAPWDLLKILDDDILVSELTKYAYEVKDFSKSTL